jgi:hypothetical protein
MSEYSLDTIPAAVGVAAQDVDNAVFEFLSKSPANAKKAQSDTTTNLTVGTTTKKTISDALQETGLNEGESEAVIQAMITHGKLTFDTAGKLETAEGSVSGVVTLKSVLILTEKEMSKLSLSSMSETGIKLNIKNAILALVQTSAKQLGDTIKGVAQKM